MKKTMLTLFLLMACIMAKGDVTQKKIYLSGTAYMDVFIPDEDKANGRAILICPGGGYEYLASGSEGTDWAPFLNERGYLVAVLAYRMPQGKADRPLGDAMDAVKRIRQRAASWHVEDGCVGVMGFSAGGHLASTLATHADAASGARPDFQILFYPVITMDPSYTHMGSHDNLLGTNPTEAKEIEYSNEKQVTDTTPPAFITYAADDGTVSPDNAKNYYQALLDHQIPAYIKEYPTGGHGFGFKTTFAYHDDMLSELSTWLEGLDDLLPDAIEAPQSGSSHAASMIYTLGGQPVGTSLQSLPRGFYVRDGKKIYK